MRRSIPIPVSGGLVLSYRCTSRCRHCIYACRPEWSTDWIPRENLERTLSGLAGKILPAPGGPESVGLNHGLHFTGGEPFANFEVLLQAVAIARECSIPSTFVETNAFWATDDGTARERLSSLKAESILHEPCPTPLLHPWHNQFDNYGNYVPGFCAGISLGDLRRHLAESGAFPELAPAEFYRHLED